MRGVLIGAMCGVAATLIALGVVQVLPESARFKFTGALMWAAHPVAVALAAVTRQPLQQEMSLVLHLLAVPISFVLAGALLGGVSAVARRAR